MKSQSFSCPTCGALAAIESYVKTTLKEGVAVKTKITMRRCLRLAGITHKKRQNTKERFACPVVIISEEPLSTE